jgi:hypothetical protein
MPATEVTPDVSRDTASGEVTTECAVCPHPRTFHDRIATRYCTATIAGQFSRGCVCTPYPPDTTPGQDTR